jgi:hypothetical protein
MRLKDYIKNRKGILAIGALTLALVASLLVPLVATPAQAHMPGSKPPPEFELEPIVITDGGVEIEITVADIGDYHHTRMKEIKTKMLKQKGKTDEEIARVIEKEFGDVSGAEAICSCASGAYRVAKLGISQVWGDEIPERSDIKIISRIPTMGSMQCFQYITGTGPKIPNVTNKGEFHMILLDGTEITDFSIKNVKPRSIDMDASYWNCIIIRKSTGEQFEVQVKDDALPEGFYELRKKVKFGIPAVATGEEVDEFIVKYEEVRDGFLTLPDWELFDGIEEPFPVGGAIFLGVLVIGLITGVSLGRGKKRG